MFIIRNLSETLARKCEKHFFKVLKEKYLLLNQNSISIKKPKNKIIIILREKKTFPA